MPQRILLLKSFSPRSKVAGVVPPLGCLSLAAYLRQQSGAEVRVVDLRFEGGPEEAVRRELAAFRPALLGISAITPEAEVAHRAARAARQAEPAVPVIIGGPYPSSMTERAVADPAIDAAVVGEGEETLCELAGLIEEAGAGWRRPELLGRVAGVAFRDPDGRLASTPPRPFIDDLDGLPFPAWDLIDVRRYWRYSAMSSMGIRPYFTIFTSRGCPYRCSYCHNLFGKRFRARSPESVVAEVAWLFDRYGPVDLEVLDDIANLDRRRLRAILTGLLERNLGPRLSFPNGVRTDLLDHETVRLLKRVGTGEVSVAVETASPRLQAMVGKSLDLERVRGNIELMARERIFTRGFFMLGFPTETEEEMRSTIDFAVSSPLHLAMFFVVNPFPGTGLEALFRQHGRPLDGYDTLQFEYSGAPFNASDIPDDRFRRLYRQAYLRFYLDPVRIARIVRDRPLKGDIPARAWKLARNYLSFRKL